MGELCRTHSGGSVIYDECGRGQATAKQLLEHKRNVSIRAVLRLLQRGAGDELQTPEGSKN